MWAPHPCGTCYTPAAMKVVTWNVNGIRARKAQVLKFVADPAEAAKVYGQETGICCVCNATLKSKWRLRGIGPVCAEKMGWAGLAEDFGVDV